MQKEIQGKFNPGCHLQLGSFPTHFLAEAANDSPLAYKLVFSKSLRFGLQAFRLFFIIKNLNYVFASVSAFTWRKT